MSMHDLMRALTPGAGTLREELGAALTILSDETAIRTLGTAYPLARKPWARSFARWQISAAAEVLPRYTDAADERAILVDLLAELSARRAGTWEE